MMDDVRTYYLQMNMKYLFYKNNDILIMYDSVIKKNQKTV